LLPSSPHLTRAIRKKKTGSRLGQEGGNFSGRINVLISMIGVIGSPEPVQKANFAKNLAEALLECLLEAGELIPYAVVLALFGFAAYLVAGMVYHLMFDPNGVDVATRLDLLSIDPDKWFHHS
jgi:hypothetical protein